MYQKRSYGIMPRDISGLFGDLMQNGWNRVSEEVSGFSAPVNIHETDKSYEMQFMVPGIKKEDIKISVDKNILTVSYEHKDENTQQTENKWLRSEYKMRSFKRSFTINEKMDPSAITARYTDGVLFVGLLKKEESEVATKEIAIN